jgi:hypothetical protein
VFLAGVVGSAQPTKTVAPGYPRNAAGNGIEAVICYSLYLDMDGTPKHISMTSAKVYKDSQENAKPVYANVFADQSTKAISQWRFVPPATEALREIPKRYCLDFKLANTSKDRNERKEINEMVERVTSNEEDAEALFYLAGKFERVSNTLNFNHRADKANEARATANNFYLRSAVYGKAEAQFRTATDLLTGNQCAKDPKKGILWLAMAAQQGHRESQYLLSSRLMTGDEVQRQPEKALHWLKAAADAGHEQAALEYAKHLVTTDKTNADRASAYLPKTVDDNNIIQLETLALIEAHRGNFDKAVQYQTIVVSIAKELEFKLGEREIALNAYLKDQTPPSKNL